MLRSALLRKGYVLGEYKSPKPRVVGSSPAAPTTEDDCSPSVPDLNTLPRFWTKVDRSNANGCWPWTGFYDSDGYGRLKRPRGEWIGGGQKSIRAHRIACEIANGPSPKGALALHAVGCTTRLCCNPAHLRWGSNAENQRDVAAAGSRRGARNGRVRLTEQQAKAIRRQVLAGATKASVAREYGVSVGCVRHIADGSTWRHLWIENPRSSPLAAEASR